LLLLNTFDARARGVPRPRDTKDWLLDQAGEPRLAMARKDNVESLHYRDPASGAWRAIGSARLVGGSSDLPSPLGFAPDGRLFVVSRGERDTTALHSFDLARGKPDEPPLLVTAGYDFQGELVATRDRLLGVRYVTDAEATHWFDPALRAVQADIDARLPATINRISVPLRAETAWVLVESYSDVQPPVFALYDTANKTFMQVGASHPHIEPARMGRQDMVRYKAGDGLEIPALLTLPAGGNGKNLPLVVLVHGGPYVRGSVWGWNAESQFLASRGYAVLEPAFRGSTGFGDRHFRAGWKQWGLAMQDDLADGARWAIAAGVADPKRICIAGASYGGYAALMGLVKHPALFKCGVNYVGVTDLNLLFNGHWSRLDDISDYARKYAMPDLIGDPVRDAAQFEATSPLKQAARITQPLLLAYGGADRRVPLYHGKKLRDAVSKTNRQVEWVVYESEGHGWALPQNRIDFWTRVEKFLDRTIGKQ
jgi:dipeptidyl aminopeptidase/acylaminoacyl peptidase